MIQFFGQYACEKNGTFYKFHTYTYKTIKKS